MENNFSKELNVLYLISVLLNYNIYNFYKKLQNSTGLFDSI